MLLAFIAVIAPSLSGCPRGDTILVSVLTPEPLDKARVLLRDDATKAWAYDSGWLDASMPKKPGDLEFGITLGHPGPYTAFVFGLKGARECLPGFGPGDAAASMQGAKQFYHATPLKMAVGNVSVDALLVEITGHDADCDLFPDAAGNVAAHLLDCNEADGSVNPLATEQCGNMVDEDCDGQTAGDCVDTDGDGDPDNTDCDKNNPARHHPNPKDPFPESPNCCGYSLKKMGADASKMFGDPTCHPALCNDDIDQDCSGSDEPCKRDNDCDTFLAATMQQGCMAPANDPPGDDCNDCDPTIYKGAAEVCGDNKDNNCNGSIDEVCTTCDLDGDGYQRDDKPNNCPNGMNAHPGMVDCNDEDRGIYPGVAVTIRCDDKAQGAATCASRGYCLALRKTIVECAPNTPAGCPPATCDVDGDGFVDMAKKGDMVCDPGGMRGLYDCNDKEVTVYPGAPEKCGDTIDQNCDGSDQTCMGIQDGDGDGYYASNPGRNDLNDCDDARPGVRPFAVEVCNGIDDDCDGLVDEGNPDGKGVAMTKATICTDSNSGECGKSPGHCVCSASPVDQHYFADPAKGETRMLCPTEPTDPKAPGPAARCYFATQPKPELCDGLDNDCSASTDELDPPNHAMAGVATDCAGPLPEKQICCASLSIGKAPACVDPRKDPDNCGGCGAVDRTAICSGNNMATRTCGIDMQSNKGVCNGMCAVGFADCNGNKQSDGCEINLLANPLHCDKCNQPCSGNNVPTPICSNQGGKGVCTGLCAAGFADCNNNKLTDGCEDNVVKDPDNCGMGGGVGQGMGAGCGVKCSNANMATRTCNGGVCDGNCNANFGDCNNDKLTDGCEDNVASDPDNCGTGGGVGRGQAAGCGVKCSATNVAKRTCTNGVCTGDCANLFADCNTDKLKDGCELNVGTDPNNCGLGGTNGGGRGQAAGCGVVCSSANMATRTCAAGVCNGNCNNGFADCNTDKLTDGCEDPVLTDPDNCGMGGGVGRGMGAGCGVKCSANNIAMRTCGGGVCNGTCLAGFGDCNTDKLADGCEVNVAQDPNNCGAGGGVGRGMAAGCGVVCSNANMATRTCNGGICDGNCNNLFADCNNNKLGDGCELNVGTDPNNCGPGGGIGRGMGAGCGFVCSSTNVVTRTCSGGICNGTCLGGWADCNNNKQGDGCELNVANDPNNCGAGGGAGQGMAAGCGVVCSSNNMATRTCGGGVCNGNCNPGFADCNVNKRTDGCEVNVANDPDNCGTGGGAGQGMGVGCGVKCSANNMATRTCGNGVCNGQCANGFADCNMNKLNDGCEKNLNTDPDNCSGCGIICSNNNMATRMCGGGVCNGMCANGFADCDNNKLSNGCEKNLNNDPDNCGGCGIVCSGNNMATRTCVNGVCAGTCNVGFADCDGNKQMNGCEINTNTDPTHCGACPNNCSNNNLMTPTCAAGVCNGACNMGFADCNGNKLTDGCERNLNTDTANCGQCGRACSANNIAMTVCAGGACTGNCNLGFADCNNNKQTDGCEINTNTDANNCGACTTVCSAANMATRTCGGGTCNGNCNAGFADCDNNKQANGCEINTAGDPNNCGGCGNICSSNNMQTRTCGNSLCNGACSANFADCNGNKLSDGCERNINTDPDNCGQCGRVCSSNNMQTRTCGGGTCNGACSANFGDCDGNKQLNGCERNFLTDPDNCGGCGIVCSANGMMTRICQNGVCSGSCSAGFADCDGNKQTNGCERSLNTDPDNCGGCGITCSNNNMQTRTCSGGACNGTCNANFADCDGNKQLNGCERDLNTDPDNCGQCLRICSSNNIQARTCAAGVCNGSCTNGFGDCNGNKQTDGCETPLNTLTNCGTCGTTCSLANAIATCATGTCVIQTCNANWANCDGVEANGCEQFGVLCQK